MTLRSPLQLVWTLALLFAGAGLEPVEQDGYTLEWTSVSWEGGVNLRGGQMQWEASLTGKLAGPPDRQVVAYKVEMEEVVDAHGKSLLPSELERRWGEQQRKPRENQVHRVAGRRGEQGDLGAFHASLGNSTRPAANIAKARGAVYVMEVTQSSEVDLPLDRTPVAWREGAGGLKFRIEGSEVRGHQVLVTLSHTLGDEAAGSEDLTRPPYLYSAVTLNDKGEEEPMQVASFSNRGDGQLIVNVFSQTGEAVKPAALRLKIATDVRERKIAFELSNLDLGLGSKKPVAGGNEEVEEKEKQEEQDAVER